MRKGLLLILCSIILSGCAINWHQKPDKFETYPEVMLPFTSNSNKPITIVVPHNAGELLAENLNAFAGKGANLYYDLDEAYKIVSEHMTETLKRNNVTVSSNSSKYLKFTISKIQTEMWGMFVQGCYLHFTIETSDGYKQNYKVQDQSGSHMDRAVGGALSRAVERTFQDQNIIKFIEKK